MGTLTGTPTLVVAEVYPAIPTTPCYQGEGPSAGRRCMFIRLGGCNLTCGWTRTRHGLEPVPGAWRCDEAFTWHPGHGMHQRLTRVPVPDLTAVVTSRAPILVIITGGEPLIHQDQPGWPALLGTILAAGCDIEIETNGTLIPSQEHPRIRYNTSPKLASSGLAYHDRLIPAAMAWHARHSSVFKFVATSPADVHEAATVTQTADIPPHRVWIMPEGITPDRILDVARTITPAVAAHGFNLTLRQQVLLYGEQGEPRG